MIVDEVTDDDGAVDLCPDDIVVDKESTVDDDDDDDDNSLESFS